MKHKFIPYILFSAMLLSTASCNNQQATSEEEEEEEIDVNDIELTQKQLKAVDIKTGHLEQKDLGQLIRANGQLNLDPQCKAEVTSLVGGIVRTICIHEGNHVGKGQVVAYIENTDIVEMQRNYMTAVTEMQEAKLNLERQNTLKQQGAGVQKNLQQAQAAFNSSQAQVNGIGQQLMQLGLSPKAVAAGKFTTQIPIKSPIAGVVGAIKASIGSYVDMQSVMTTIVDNSKMHCDLRIFEKDIPYIKPGQEVDIILTNVQNIQLKGKIYAINQAFDDDTKAVKAHVNITSHPSVTLMPDMYVTGKINVGNHLVSALPDEAIITKDGKKQVFMLTKAEKDISHFQMVEVQTGISDKGYTEVTFIKQVPANATFVTANAFYIASMIEGEAEEE